MSNSRRQRNHKRDKRRRIRRQAELWASKAWLVYPEWCRRVHHYDFLYHETFDAKKILIEFGVLRPTNQQVYKLIRCITDTQKEKR